MQFGFQVLSRWVAVIAEGGIWRNIQQRSGVMDNDDEEDCTDRNNLFLLNFRPSMLVVARWIRNRTVPG